MKKNILLITVWIMLSITGLVYGTVLRYDNDQTFLNDFVHRVYTSADGLPGMTVNAIIQDNKGYLWIGTYDGLVRFDGVEFVTFSRYTDSKYDFASACCIMQDSAGNIWVGHNGEGLSVITTNGDVFKYDKSNGLPDNKVNTMCEDQEGNIWIGTLGGICCRSRSGEFVIPDCFLELGLENITVVQLLCDSAGRIWISTGNADSLLIYTNKTIIKYSGITQIEHPTVRALYQDKSGAFWFGVDPYYVVRIKDDDETVYNIGHESIAGTAVEAIMQDSSGNYWFSTDDGLTIMHNGLFSYYDKKSGSPDNGVNSVVEDSEGNFWIPYNRGGLEKLSSGRFRTVRMNTTVNAICEDKQRALTWIAADNGVYAYKDNKFVDNKVTAFCKGARVRHVEMTNDGELLISSYSAKMPQIRVMPNDDISVWTAQNGFDGIKCRVSIKAKNGDYYAGTTTGLNILCHENNQWIELDKKDGFDNEYIMWLYEDDDGQIWVGTNGGGMYILKDRRIVKHYGKAEGLAGNVIFKINKIGSNIWITSGTGISIYIPQNQSFVNFKSTMGLGTDNIFQILVDYTNTAWITTNKGIFSVNFSDLTEVAEGKGSKVSVKYYGNSDGLITSGVTGVSLGIIDSHGRVRFPLVDGFAIYDPVRASKNNTAPKIEIQQYVIDSESYNYSDQNIILPAGTKRFSVKYTGISFISSESIRFRCMLEGFDEDYSDWSSQRTVSYTNLPYGLYRLKIISQNSDEVSSEPTVITIIKKPFIWELLWFWVGIAIVVMGAAVLIVLIKIKKMHNYQIELERKVDERTQELRIANEKAEKLLLNILPSDVAAELTEHPDRTIAKKFANVTVLFTDIVGFTKMSGSMSAEEVITMLNSMVSLFDERAKREGIEKIKTIGDAYMAAVGFTEDAGSDCAVRMIRFAKGLLEDVATFNKDNASNICIRVGVNTGELVAGIIGKTKFIYDIWGDTVNVASRMESTGEAMKIHISEATYNQTKDEFSYSDAVNAEIKGKGIMKTYFL